MPNIHNTNTAPAANGPALSETIGLVYPKATVAAISAISKDIERIGRERAKWLRPEAEKAIYDRRVLAHAHPSETNLAALTGETPEALTARYEATANELHGVIETTKKALHPHYLVILDTLRTALTAQMGKLEAVNRKAFAAWGVPYDAANDAMLLSLARFLDNAAGKLDNERCVCWPDELKTFLGELKPAGGLFSK
jgi:hypothetical protein